LGISCVMLSLMPNSRLTRQIDIVSLVVGEQAPFFVGQVDANKKRLFDGSMSGDPPEVPIQDIFTLYRRTTTLLGMYRAFVPQ
jgi:hypothetical protein